MISDRFFEDEVREGFYVPSAIKQAWGAELTVLKQIDKVCRKHGIKYFADCGTYLGAVRHGGIIPWDDDFDICMRRDEYNKFLKVWKQELPQGYDVINFTTHPEHTKFLANVVGKSRICFEPEHLTNFHGFPYIAGVDIFVLDNRNRNLDKEKKRVNVALYIISSADDIFDGKCAANEKENRLQNIEKWCNVKVNRQLEGEELRAKLYQIAETEFARFSDEECDEVVRMMPHGLGLTKVMKSYQMEDYKSFIDIPFEDMMIPVPTRYNAILSKMYGDYMKLYKGGGAHGYPFFEKQRDDLYRDLNMEIPEYRCPELVGSTEPAVFSTLADSTKLAVSSELIEASGQTESYKVIVNECLDELDKEIDAIKGFIIECGADNICVSLAQMQQLIVDMGNYIEGVKGEGYDVIHLLEELCETLFGLYDYVSVNGVNGVTTVTIGNSNTVNADNTDDINTLLFKISDKLREVKEVISRRKEMVFLPYKAEYWHVFDSLWDMASKNPDIDVYVVPISYYYKSWDGTLRDEQYIIESYPEKLHCIRYDEFNFEIHHPDTIVIQNPYDEWNNVSSLNPFFYSSNIKKYTDELIYIPWFTLKEFGVDDLREYKNMKYYCNMPGVINADKVYVQSDNMRQLYIKKLTDFAGNESTKAIWEEKIICNKPVDADCSSNGNKKVLVYYNELFAFFENGDTILAKIKESLSTFEKSKDTILLVWKNNEKLESLKDKNRTLYNDYIKLVDEYVSAGWGRYDSDMDYEALASCCDAYYGDAGALANAVRNHNKPVMLQNYSIF